MKTISSLALLGAILFTGACATDDDGSTDDDTVDTDPGDGNPDTKPQPTLRQEDYDDVAESMATVVVTGNGGGEIASLHDSVSLSVGVVPLDLVFQAQGNIFGTRAGVSYKYDVSCKDAQGNALARCNNQTDKATVQLVWSGNLDTARYDAAVDRHGTWNLAGLQTNTVELAGASSFELTSHFQALNANVERDYHLKYAATYNGIHIDRPSRDVVSGKITYAIDAERMVTGTQHDVEATFHVNAELTFDSRDHATLVIDGKATYDLNVQTGVIVRR